MPKLTVHTQIPPPWLGDFLRESGAAYYKGIGALPAFDGVTIIGRVVVPENKEPEPLNTFIASGIPGADHVFNACVPEIAKNPQVEYWSLYNESSVWEQRVLDGFVAFNQQLIYRFKQEFPNKKIIVGEINTGHPKMMDEPGGMEQLDIISRAFQGADGYAVHCYHPYDLSVAGRYFACRYREMHDYCVSIGRPHPPFFVLECGLDAPGGPSHGHFGWKSILTGNWPAYRNMLLWYERELQKDDYVQCATVYIAEDTYGWEDFELNQLHAMDLANALSDQPTPTPSPSPSPVPPGEIEYVWYDGSKVSEAKFREEFGAFYIESDPNAQYRIVRLKAIASSQSFWFYLLDKDGKPVQGEDVVLSWPTAPRLPGSGWDNKGITAPLKANGGAEHILGDDAYYYPPEGGPHKAWVYGPGKSDLFGGFGWLGGTQYNHIDVAAQEVGVEPSPSPGYYYIYYSPEPEEGGYIIAQPEPVDNQLPEGTEVTLTAYANPGWKFVNWSDKGGVAERNPLIVPMIKDWAIAANFVKEGGEIDVPAAIEDGYMAIEHIEDALRHLGEDV